MAKEWSYFEKRFIKSLKIKNYLDETGLDKFLEEKKKEYKEILQEQNPLLREILLFNEKFYSIEEFIEELEKLGIEKETAWYIIQNTRKVIHWFKEKPGWYDECQMYKKIAGC